MTAAAPAAIDRPGALIPMAAVGGGVLAALDPRLALGAAVAVPFLVLTSLRTKVIAYFAVLPLIWSVQVQYPASTAKAVPAFITVAIALHLGWELVVGTARIPVRPFTVAAGAFAALAVLQMINPVILPTHAGWTGVRVYVEPFTLFIAGLVVLPRPGTVVGFFRVIVATALVVGLDVLRQAIGGFTASEIAYQSQEQIRTIAEKKVFSSLPGPAVLGFVAGAFVLLCLLARSADVWPRLAMLGAALNGIGVVACGVRMSLIATSVATVLLLLLLVRDPTARSLGVRTSLVALVVVAILGSAVAAATIGERNDTFESPTAFNAAVVKLALLKQGTADTDVASRIDRLRLFSSYIIRHPVGAGPGLVSLVDASTITDPDVKRPPLPAYILHAPWIFQHDFYYVALGAELGLVGLVLFVVLLVVGATVAIRRRWWHEDRLTRALLDSTATVAVLTLLYCVTNESFRTPQVAGYVWFLLAAPVVLRRPATTTAAHP